MKRSLKVALLCIILAPAPSIAAPVFDVAISDVVLTILTETADPTNVVSYDVRGGALIVVSDPGLIGGFFLTDPTNIGLPAPPPNAFFFSIDGTLTEGGIVATHSPSVSGPGATLRANFFPLTPITDPGLAAFAGADPYLFGFSFLSALTIGSDTLSFYEFATVTAVPEPTVLALLTLGAAFGASRFRRARR